MTFFEYSALVGVLNGWTEKYAAGSPEVDDATFDAEYRRMKQFETENPGLILDTSPSRKVSAIAELKSAGYDIRVLSPGDRKEIEKLLEIV